MEAFKQVAKNACFASGKLSSCFAASLRSRLTTALLSNVAGPIIKTGETSGDAATAAAGDLVASGDLAGLLDGEGFAALGAALADGGGEGGSGSETFSFGASLGGGSRRLGSSLCTTAGTGLSSVAEEPPC